MTPKHGKHRVKEIAMTRRARLWITGATTSDRGRAQHLAPAPACRSSHPAPGRRHERQRPSRHGGMGLRSWTSWRRNCAPAAGAPTSQPRLGGWRPCSCKTRTIIRSAATSSPPSIPPLGTGGTGSAGPSGSRPPTRLLPQRMRSSWPSSGPRTSPNHPALQPAASRQDHRVRRHTPSQQSPLRPDATRQAPR